MKRTIYWSVEGNSGQASYYLNKNTMLGDWGSAKYFLVNVQKHNVRFYSLEVDITDDILVELFNGKFHHCHFPNYRDAKLIEVNQAPTQKGAHTP